MFQICLMMPLPSEDHVCYNGMVFDGYQYYLIPKGKKNIVKTDSCFKNMESIPTRRIYTTICYDSKEKCFWAASKESTNELFKLSDTFQEIGRIKLAPFPGMISGISYCCWDDSLLVSTKNKIFRTNKSCPPNTKEIWNCSGEVIAGVISLSPCFLYYYFLKDLQRIRIVTEDGSILEEIVPAKEKLTPANDFIIEHVIYHGQRDNCYYFQILATEHGNQQYLLEAKLEQNILGDLYPCNHTLFEKDSAPLSDVLELESNLNNLQCQDCALTSIPQTKGRRSCVSCNPSCNPCKDCRCDCHFPCKPCPKYCNDVLESIALVETSIAHI
ncbi:MAG: hypothetical protein RR705_08245, partial [Lachnospiraceae bacterium]